ncbi:MAG: hypothetical protein PHP11_05635 [Erysipelotrichaceae bacterium]|nr:hypothetical protein [Erysipelotrichaceae bacterium]MDD3924563.1 hypothetical protein [Erysipelotrichaceae bacterium]MDD4642163.1 hypothetical protein [Erysipelotrichaceae bacterium]
MNKQLTRIIFTVIFTICFGIAAYFYFQPKQAALVADNMINLKNNKLTYLNINEHILADEQIHYLWLCDINDNDCIYVRDYVIKPLVKELNVNEINDIEYVDFYEAPTSKHYMYNTWGVDNYPAFIAAQNIDGKISVLNSLAWDKDNPFDQQDLKTWMYDNGIWNGVYQVEEKIAPAINN